MAMLNNQMVSHIEYISAIEKMSAIVIEFWKNPIGSKFI